MFKQASFASEILHSMEKSLVKNQTENTHGLSKLAKAVDYLNDAAAIFEKAGMSEEASLITDILYSIAKEIDDASNSPSELDSYSPSEMELIDKDLAWYQDMSPEEKGLVNSLPKHLRLPFIRDNRKKYLETKATREIK